MSAQPHVSPGRLEVNHAPMKGRRKIAVDASTFLASIDTDWAQLVARLGPCGHEPKPAREPFEALVRAVAYQQLHVKAGDAILARLLALYPQPSFPTPAQLLDAGFDAMRACGFSARKIETEFVEVCGHVVVAIVG